jgi:hypothetical protein
MKKYVIILLLAISSIGRTAGRYDSVDIQYKDIAFTTGYVFSSVYDIGYEADKKSNTHSVGWKMGLGLLGGLAIAIGHADRESREIQFTDVVFGGLGGLTCVVVHF